jgi:5,10-methenyltetrahydrofolate synthetase
MCLDDLQINYPNPIQQIGFYYPIRGEPDLRNGLLSWQRSAPDRVLALPVTKAQEPLKFCLWNENTATSPGYADIPEPIHSSVVEVDAIIAPCVGWKRSNGRFWRLGYGGGFYDRTLHSLHQKKKSPVLIGIGFDEFMLQDDDWAPQHHDWPLDAIVTESFYNLSNTISK